jgi:hypothetical protein
MLELHVTKQVHQSNDSVAAGPSSSIAAMKLVTPFPPNAVSTLKDRKSSADKLAMVERSMQPSTSSNEVLADSLLDHPSARLVVPEDAAL